MGLMAGVLAYEFVVARFVYTPRAVGFRLIIGLILALNVLWWSVADRRFARHVRSARRARWLRWIAAAFSGAVTLPVLYMFVMARMPAFLDVGPTWYAAAVTLWNLGLAFCMPAVALVRLAGLGVLYVARRLRARGGTVGAAATDAERRDASVADAEPRDASVAEAGPCGATATDAGRRETSVADTKSFDVGRRAVLRTAFASLPMLMLVGATGVSRRQEGVFEVNRHRLPAPWLPERLRGLTITHISDLHLGRHYRVSMLPRLIESANRLSGDLVVVTGDIVDHSNDVLPAAMHALSQLVHRYGLFVCIGNHDEIDDRAAFIRYTREFFPLLVNQRRILEIGGERLTIAGVDYAFTGRPVGFRSGHRINVERTLEGYDRRQEGPVIALAHHPDTWDDLSAGGVPLTLAGHTHGGQIMFTPPGSRTEPGIGRLLFRYVRGFYRKEGSTLFVNRGVGNWFPLRVNAPAEMVQIQLV